MKCIKCNENDAEHDKWCNDCYESRGDIDALHFLSIADKLDSTDMEIPMLINRFHEGLLNHVKKFTKSMDADTSLLKFELDYVIEGSEIVIYICNDYAVGIETTSMDYIGRYPRVRISAKEVVTKKVIYGPISRTPHKGFVSLKYFEPSWCVAKNGKIRSNRWWDLIIKYNLPLILHDYSKYPQTKALVDFIQENNDEQLRIEMEKESS